MEYDCSAILRIKMIRKHYIATLRRVTMVDKH